MWLLLAELSRSQIRQLPNDAPSAALAASQRNDAAWAAWIGGIRGDLWMESGFTFAELLWTNPDGRPESTKLMDHIRIVLDHAVKYAPHQSEAWLLSAGLASQRTDPVEALKMSYYTAPSELRLLPLRLLVAARLQSLADAEIQQFVRRDLRLALARLQRSAVTDAYQRASPAGRRFIEQALIDIDPAFLRSLPPGKQSP